MLAVHAEGNIKIANRFLGGSARALFTEPDPDVNAQWQEYGGLSADRATEIALQIHELIKSSVK
jgi:hypothetical protein